MIDLFKGELLRFRWWALAAGIINLAVLGFLSRMVDMAQQPLIVYQVFAAVYALAGILLGMYQMGTYRKPNQWLNLMHRPLHRLHIAGALTGAGALLLLLATAVPIALVATYQETMTARVVDLRHWMLPLAAWLITVTGYLAGGYAMVGNRRYSFAAFLLPNLFMYAQASGVAMLGVQIVAIAFLALLLAIAFKPNPTAPPRNPAAVLAVALPVQLGAYFLIWMLGFGVELAWTITGTHPLNMPVPPKGGYIEADRAEGKDMLLLGIEGSRDPEAALWREQVALSDVYTAYPLRNLPVRQSMTNLSPMEFGDDENNLWMVFSHDRERFVTRGLRDQRRIGEMGVGEEQAAFPAPTMPYGATYLYNAHAAYQYDSEQRRIFERFRLPTDEVMASPPEPAGDNIVVLSDRAAYFYPGREATNGLDLLQPLMRVAMPGPVGNLSRMDVIELLDGYLVSYTYTWGVWSGELQHPFQQVLRVDGKGQTRKIAHRALSIDLPPVYTNRNTWLSPVLRAICLGAQDLFAAPDPLRAKPEPMPAPILWLAGACWSRDGRWLFLRASRALSVVAADGRSGVRVPLGGTERRRVMKLDPSQPAAVLLGERVRAGKGERWRVVRVDARGKRTVLREDAHWIHDVALDAQGRIVALARFEGDHDALYRVRADGTLREVLRLRPMERLELLTARDDGSLLMAGNPGGDFRRVMRLDADDKLHTLHQDPRGEADLDEFVVDPRTQQPLAASYRSTVAATYGFGDAQAVVADIARKFPARDIGLQAGGGPSARWLVSERAPTLRDPRWYLYDPRNGSLHRILDDPGIVASSPPESSLARKLAIAYTASDGKRVRGFLLLPPGVDAARAPLIAQVHGGPINHFRAGYDGAAQFLANRGYVVFQSNFRGSTGHGLAYTFSSNGDYGNGRVQQDIVEGVRWLLAQGIGDANRVGIVGHSFGGYSTLLGLTFQSDLFKVGVAGSPPADLGWSMRWLLQAGDQGDLPDRSLKHTLAALSLDSTDTATYARLHAQSPLVNAAKMHRPLLVIAGGADRTVAIREVVNYAATLQAAKRPMTLLVEPNGGHSPVDPVPREAYLFAMETMLQRHLGGAAPEPPGQRLRAYLRQNLRVAGPEFARYAQKPR